jgi:predicted enzyme related to lactoylglutathione lyase
MTTLTYAPLVMIWRRVSDLPAAKRNVSRVNGWPAVGEDGYSAMYDAGNVLVAFWNQAEFLREQARPAGRRPASGPAGSVAKVELAQPTEACSDQNLTARSTAYNPSNQLTLVVEDTGLVTETLSTLTGRPLRPLEVRDRMGRAISFVDDVGNTTRYVRLSKAAAANGIGRRLKSLRDAGLPASGTFHPVIGYELLVSDASASREFYGDVLGLRADSTAADEDSMAFDTGNVLLTLRSEPSAGLVRTIERAGKLADDLAVFYSDNVEVAVDELSRKGVRFPNGIEDSQHGRLAVFKDPDGHALSLWQPPARGQETRIDYFPVLDRLLASAAALGDR